MQYTKTAAYNLFYSSQCNLFVVMIFEKSRSSEKLEVISPISLNFRNFFCDFWLFFLGSALLFGFLSKLYGFLASDPELFF